MKLIFEWRVRMVRRFVALACVSIVAVAFSGGLGATQTSAKPKVADSVVERDAVVAVRQPGPHQGGGETTAYPFFAKAPDFKMAFRKRVLHKGAAIGYHLQEFDEVFYILSGTGEFTLNGARQSVGAGTAILTRPGSSHGLRQMGREDLVMIIAYSTTGQTR